MILGGFGHETAQARALMGGVHGELAHITARAAHLSVDAGDKPAGAVFGEENAAFAHHGR